MRTETKSDGAASLPISLRFRKEWRKWSEKTKERAAGYFVDVLTTSGEGGRELDDVGKYVS